MCVTKEGERDLKKHIGSRVMRFQTNTGYANSKKWNGICF